MNERFTVTAEEIQILSDYGLDFKKLHNCSIREYNFGERLISEGLPNGRLFFVIRGKAKVGVIAPNGKNLILCFYISSGLMGEVELFSDLSVGSTSVTALDHFCCLTVPIDANKPYLLENAAFIRTAAAELAKKLTQSTRRVVESSLYTAEIRLCRYIAATSDNSYFRDVMTDAAYSIGVSYRHLYRMLGTLCTDGVLKKDKTGYRICDHDELLRRCQPH